MGQGWALQDWVDLRMGQAEPPNFEGVIIERVFDWKPPPHFSVHVDQELKALTVQCTAVGEGVGAEVGVGVGHTGPWTGSPSFLAPGFEGHGSPPYSAFVSIL
jgi:hypothetical protein